MATKLSLTGITFPDTTVQTTAASGGNPEGTIIQFAGTTAPTGYLLCPTSLTNISRTTYATLFAAIGTTWGAGNGTTTFGLPWFAANYAAIQANANVGTASTGEVIAHTHTVYDYSTTNEGGANIINQVNVNATVNTGSTGGSANLAAGARVLFCIKY
jgi:microcystin-dependent protein